jgi:hypothetical protein
VKGKVHTGVWLRSLREKRALANLSVGCRIILKRIFKKKYVQGTRGLD